MNHYPHHIGDFDRATRHLNRIERSIYRDFLDLYYDTEKKLSLDLQKLKRKILANSSEESTAVEQVLNEYFTETPTGWYHSRCEAEILRYQTNNSQKAMAGNASATARALRKQQALNGESTDSTTSVGAAVEQTPNGTLTNQNQNQNQEPIKREPKGSKAVSVFELPDWINKSHWDIWHSSPKRKAANHAQKQIAIDKLTRWRDEGLDYAKALEDAAAAGWQGLVDPKPKMNTSLASGYETPYAKFMREKYEQVVPQIAAKNPSAPRIDPNEFLRTIEVPNAVKKLT